MDEAPGIVVAGAAGRMGRMLARAVLEAADAGTARLVGLVVREGHPWAGRDAGEALGLPASSLPQGLPRGLRVTDDPVEALARAQGVLDFTAPAATVEFAALAAQARAVHVVGTTGLGAEDLRRIGLAARHAPVVRAGNMSLGVNLLVGLARRVAEALGEDWDAEVVEMHHRMKADAPSGTALMLGEAVAAGRGVALAEAADRARDGLVGPRGRGRIGFASLRGGDVVGEHEVIFAGEGERVALRHVATDRMVFARGAVRAALWGQGRPPGEYTMMDVLGL
jgi:4-hydroxy-tetrahydrodipicolinate reductase